MSQNHRMVRVGRDLCGSSSPTLLPKQGHLQHIPLWIEHILTNAAGPKVAWPLDVDIGYFTTFPNIADKKNPTLEII